MEQEQLEKLLENLVSLPKENETIEFKRNNTDKNVIGRNISALSNSAALNDAKFAYMVFGVKDKNHEILGTTFKLEQQIVGSIELEFWLQQKLTPKIDFSIYEFSYQGKSIVLFKIHPATTKPISFDKVAYIRIGSSTTTLERFDDKERRIWNNIQNKTFEKGIAKENLSASEVLELLDYSKYFSLTKQELPPETKQFVEKMAQHNLVKRVLENHYDITNLGAILFAKDLKKFPSIKRKAVRVVIYKGNTRVVRDKEIEGHFGYAIAFEGLLEYVNDKLPFNEEISKSLRKEIKMYPEVAIREFIANALIHQDLSINGAGPMVEIFGDRVEVTNTGEPLIDTDRFIDHPPRSRNEDMASFMRQIGVCEEGGTGIDRALTHIELYQLPAPKFEKYESHTKITLYAHKELRNMSTDDKTRACYQHCVLKCVENKRMTNATLRERLNIGERNYPTASAIIKKTIEKKLIKESEKPKEYVPIWA